MSSINREIIIGKMYSFCYGVVPIYKYFSIDQENEKVICIVSKLCTQKSLDHSIENQF